MIDRFSDDNFIEAAKAYQSIKAPSALREKVLQTAAMQEQILSGSNMAESRQPQRQKKRFAGKIYQAASLAACLAIMVAVLPDWTPDTNPVENPGPQPRGIIGEEPDLTPEGNPEVPDAYGVSEADFPPETEPGPEPVSEPVFEPDDADLPAVNPEPETEPQRSSENNPVTETGPQNVTEKEPVPPEKLQAELKKAPEADVSIPETEGETQPAEDMEGQEDVQQAAPETPTPSISVGSLLPAFLADNETLRGMQVRLVDAEDGNCTVEVILADSTTTEVMVSKNAENGHWEVTGANEE